MKGKIVGFETVDYVSKKTGNPVNAVRLFLNIKSNQVIGMKVGEEFISKDSSVYKIIEPYLNGDVDALIGADVFIDYNVEQRGNTSFKEICDLDIMPKKAEA